MSVDVLLIDDEDAPMRYYKWALERQGIIVNHCRTTESALDALSSTKPRLVILDVMMPPGIYKDKATRAGLDTGLFLLDDIIDKYPELRVLVLTNVSNQETLNKIQQSDLVQVCNKADYPPFELGALVSHELAKDAVK